MFVVEIIEMKYNPKLSWDSSGKNDSTARRRQSIEPHVETNAVGYQWNKTCKGADGDDCGQLKTIKHTNKSEVFALKLPKQDPRIGNSLLHFYSYESRRIRLRKLCDFLKNKISHNNVTTQQRYIINDAKRILYCQVSKAACTTWTSLVTDANLGYHSISDSARLMQVHAASRLRKARVFMAHDVNVARFANHTKFIVVRHPFDRILSAYYNIVDRRNSLGPGLDVALAIAKHFHATPNKLTFSQFVQFLTMSPAQKLFSDHVMYDRHWDMMYRVCNVCNVSYDYVIYFEDMPHDAMPILEQLGWPAEHLLTRSKINQRQQPGQPVFPGAYNLYLHEYKELNKSLLLKLLKMYEVDMKLFGYRFNVNTFTTAIDFKT